MRGTHSDHRLRDRLGLLGVGLLMVLYPFHFYANSVVPVNLSYGDLLIGVVGILWLVGVFGVRRLPRFSYPTIGFLLVGLFSIAVALTSNASYVVPEHSAIEYVKLLGATAWFVGTFVLCRGAAIRRTRTLALVSVLVATGFALLSAYEGLVLGELRPTGPFQNPNIYANYLVMNGFLAAYLVGSLLGTRRRHARLLSLTLPVLAVGLLVTASRGSLIGAAAGVVAVPVLHPTVRLRSVTDRTFAVPLALSAGAALVVLGANAWIRDRLLSSIQPDAKNLETRVERWRYGVEGFLEQPLTGVGFGQSQNFVSEAGYGGDYPRLHNTHLTVASETGVVGVALLYLLFGTVVAQSVRLAREHDPADAFLGCFVVASLAEGLVTGVLTFRSLWIVTGLLAALSYHHYGEELDLRDVPDDVGSALASLRGSIRRIGTS